MLKKSDLTPEPIGADPTKYVNAADWRPLQAVNAFNIVSPEFGADPTGVLDSQPAIQAAITAGVAAGTPSIIIPPGNYVISKPIKLQHSNVRILGAGSSCVTFTYVPATPWEGTAFQLTGDAAGDSIVLGTSLLTGSGSSMVLDPAATLAYLNLSEVSGADFNLTPGNGNGSFTVEFALNIDATDATPNLTPSYIILANGSGPNQVTPNGVWSFSVIPNAGVYSLIVAVCLNGTLYQSSTVITKNATHSIALSYDKVSGVAKSFLDGASTTITTQPGAQPTQTPYESVYLGAVPGFPIDGSIISTPTKCRIDGIRFSNFARYTSNYTPSSAKPTIDSQTMFLLNFDSFYGSTVVATSQATGILVSYYLIPRTVGPTNFGNIEISGLTVNLSGRGIWWNAVQGIIKDVQLNFVTCGIQFYGPFSFLGSVSDVYITMGQAPSNTANGITSRCGILAGAAAGFWEFKTVSFIGGIFQLLLLRPGFVFRNMDFVPETNTRWAIMVYSADDFDRFTMYDCAVDIEQATQALEGTLFLNHCRSTLLHGCLLNSARSDAVVVPCIQINATTDATLGTACPDPLTMEGCEFLPNPTGTLIFQQGTGRAQIVLSNCRVTNNVAFTLSNVLTNITTIGGQFGNSLRGNVADGSSAVMTTLDNRVLLGNAGAKSLVLNNAGIEKDSFLAAHGGLQISPLNGNEAAFLGYDAAAGLLAMWLGPNSVPGTRGTTNYIIASGAGTDTVISAQGGTMKLRVVGNADSVFLSSGVLDISPANNVIKLSYTDNSGTPGNTTINKTSGRMSIAAAATAVSVTNSLVAPTSVVDVNMETLDATLTRFKVVPAGGSFTVTGNAAATGTTVFSFIVFTN